MGSAICMNLGRRSVHSSSLAIHGQSLNGGHSTLSCTTNTSVARSRTALSSTRTPLRPPSSDSWRRFFSCALFCVAAFSIARVSAADQNGLPDEIDLRVQPRVCTLSATETTCRSTVKAQWHAPRSESLCLVIVDRPEVKRCWENFTDGTYSIELAFDKDLTVQLRDPELERVLASESIAVIKEALQLRRKRRQPWNLLY